MNQALHLEFSRAFSYSQHTSAINGLSLGHVALTHLGISEEGKRENAMLHSKCNNSFILASQRC